MTLFAAMLGPGAGSTRAVWMSHHRRNQFRRLSATAHSCRSGVGVEEYNSYDSLPAGRSYYREERKIVTAEERREKARLRSERWRRAHGIKPRRKAARPWLVEGISRSTWYRRRAKGRELNNTWSNALNDKCGRAEAFTRQLQTELATAALCLTIELAIIGELAEFHANPTPPFP
jgi:hypothetical protein